MSKSHSDTCVSVLSLVPIRISLIQFRFCQHMPAHGGVENAGIYPPKSCIVVKVAELSDTFFRRFSFNYSQARSRNVFPVQSLLCRVVPRESSLETVVNEYATSSSVNRKVWLAKKKHN